MATIPKMNIAGSQIVRSIAFNLPLTKSVAFKS